MARSITDIRTYPISVPLEREFWMSLEPYAVAAEIIVEIETDDGLVGIGEIHGRPQPDILQILEHTFKPRLLGLDPLEHELIWQTLFQTTFSRVSANIASADGQPHFRTSGKPQMMAALAGVDIALWDIKGKALELPLYKLLGGLHCSVPCYVSGGYYGPAGQASVEQLVEEMTGYVALGFDAVKMKIGGLAIEEDIARVRAVREALPAVRLMLDANSAYDVATAITAARAFEPFEIHWLEEPTAWFDPIFGLAEVAATTTIPLASGERELHRYGCRDLVEHGGIRFLQFDCTRAGGITEWMSAAAHAATHGVRMAPHHDPQIHGHLVAATANGYVLEVFPNHARDPLWGKLFSYGPAVAGGTLTLSERPGLGIALDRDFVDRYAVTQPKR
jgi:L-alanine-DL-glutamate epimerase-like enolase superfamily enzyme